MISRVQSADVASELRETDDQQESVPEPESIEYDQSPLQPQGSTLSVTIIILASSNFL